ncbi:Vps53-like domain-containing protein [Cryptosporidium felis]|nr:Vps53-like domain-containing protein [Cryptosporidium felis]
MEDLYVCDSSNDENKVLELFSPIESKFNEYYDEKFDLKGFINREFPSEQSLSNLPERIKAIDKALEEVDNEIGEDLLKLASSNFVKEFDDYLELIENELIPKVKDIQELSKSFQQDVENILSSIRDLDESQRNLSKSLDFLEILSVFKFITSELKIIIDSRTYTEVIPLLSIEIELRSILKNSHEVERTLSQLRDQEKKDIIWREVRMALKEMGQLLDSLREQITEDFLALIDPYILFSIDNDEGKKETIQLSPPHHLNAPQEFRKQMKSCCYCVELIGEECRTEVIEKFISKLLRPYCSLFGSSQTENFFGNKNKIAPQGKEIPGSVSGVEFLERRFGWYRRCLKEYEQQFSEVFPIKWQLPTILTEKFFFYTRRDLLQSLGDVGHLLDHHLILEYSLKCHQFEEYVISRFAQLYDQQLLLSELEKETPDHLQEPYIKSKKIKDFWRNFHRETRYCQNSNKDPCNSHALPLEAIPRFPETSGMLTECFVPYLGSFLDSEKESLLKMVTKELNPSEEMTENIQIRRETDVLGIYETIPLIWTSSTSLFKALNVIFQKIEHLLGYDDIYIQFNSLVLQTVQTYLESKLQSCNIQGPFETISASIQYSGGSSLENIVEAVVSSVSTKTSKVAATTGGILFPSVSQDKFLSCMKHEPKKIGATLGSIDYLDWMNKRIEEMMDKHQKKDISEVKEVSKEASNREVRPRGQNVMFSNYMWVSKRKILGCVVKELSRPVTLSMSEWYTKKTQKLNETVVEKNISESELPTLEYSFRGGTSSLVQVLGESLVRQYVQYSQYMPNIYKYSIICQVMLQSLRDNWNFILSLKGPLHYGTLEVVANEQQKLLSLFLELPSYFPVMYVPRAYVDNVKILVSKSIAFLRIAQKSATLINQTQLEESSIQHFTTQLYGSLGLESRRDELSALHLDLALKLGNNSIGQHQQLRPT